MAHSWLSPDEGLSSSGGNAYMYGPDMPRLVRLGAFAAICHWADETFSWWRLECESSNMYRFIGVAHVGADLYTQERVDVIERESMLDLLDELENRARIESDQTS